MGKWINAEQQVTVTVYDSEHEERLNKTMTVEEMLDAYTHEGCPPLYSDKNVGDTINRNLVLDALCDNCDNTQAVCAHYPCKQYLALEKLLVVKMKYDYDPCDECREYGDDYYYDSDGDLMQRCYDCPLWETGRKKDE